MEGGEGKEVEDEGWRELSTWAERGVGRSCLSSVLCLLSAKGQETKKRSKTGIYCCLCLLARKGYKVDIV